MRRNCITPTLQAFIAQTVKPAISDQIAIYRETEQSKDATPQDKENAYLQRIKLERRLITMDEFLKQKPVKMAEQNKKVEPYNLVLVKNKETDERKLCFLVDFELRELSDMLRGRKNDPPMQSYCTGSAMGMQLAGKEVGSNVRMNNATWVVMEIKTPSESEQIVFAPQQSHSDSPKETENITKEEGAIAQ